MKLPSKQSKSRRFFSKKFQNLKKIQSLFFTEISEKKCMEFLITFLMQLPNQFPKVLPKETAKIIFKMYQMFWEVMLKHLHGKMV